MEVHHRIYIRLGELASVPGTSFMLTGSVPSAAWATLALVFVSAVDSIGAVMAARWSGQRLVRVLFSPWRSEVLVLSASRRYLPGGPFACALSAMLLLVVAVAARALFPSVPLSPLIPMIPWLLIFSACFNLLPWPGSDGRRWSDDWVSKTIIALPVGYAVFWVGFVEGAPLALSVLPFWVMVGSVLRRHRSPRRVRAHP